MHDSISICGSNLRLDDPTHLTMVSEPPSSKIEPFKVSISRQEVHVNIYDHAFMFKIKFFL